MIAFSKEGDLCYYLFCSFAGTSGSYNQRIVFGCAISVALNAITVQSNDLNFSFLIMGSPSNY